MEGIDLAIYSVAIFTAGMGAGLGLNWIIDRIARRAAGVRP